MASLLLSMLKFYLAVLSGLRFPESALVYWDINPMAQMLQNACQKAH